MRRRTPAEAAVIVPAWVIDPKPADFPRATCHWQCDWWDAYNAWAAEHHTLDLNIPLPDGGWHPEEI